jgi:hypothetical protein
MLSVLLALLPFFTACLDPLSKASSRRARQIVGGDSRTESPEQVRQTTKQVVVQRFGLTTDHKTVSPLPKVNKCTVFTCGTLLVTATISHKVEGHYSILLYFAASNLTPSGNTVRWFSTERNNFD